MLLNLARSLTLLLVLAHPSLAGAVTLNFTGTIDFVQALVPSEIAGIAVGDNIDITLSYNQVILPDSLSAIAEGGQTVSTTSSPLFLSVIDNFGSVGDIFTAVGDGPSGMLEFFAVDPSGAAVSGTDLPTSMADLAGFQGFGFRFFLQGGFDPFGNPEPDLDFFTAVGPINVVPEPSTALLVMVGLGLLSHRRRATPQTEASTLSSPH